MAQRLSLVDAKLFYGPAGSTGGTLITNVKDLSLKMKKGEAKVDSRASRYAKRKGSLKEIEVEWEMNDDSSDAALTAIIAAFINDTPLAFLIKDAQDGHGIDGDFEVFGCDREEKLEDAVTYKINIKPCPSTRDVQWV
jgi:hypothetical protein